MESSETPTSEELEKFDAINKLRDTLRELCYHEGASGRGYPRSMLILDDLMEVEDGKTMEGHMMSVLANKGTDLRLFIFTTQGVSWMSNYFSLTGEYVTGDVVGKTTKLPNFEDNFQAACQERIKNFIETSDDILREAALMCAAEAVNESRTGEDLLYATRWAQVALNEPGQVRDTAVELLKAGTLPDLTGEELLNAVKDILRSKGREVRVRTPKSNTEGKART